MPALAVALVFGFVALSIMVLAIWRYATTPGRSVLTAFNSSATILWTHLVAFVGSLGGALMFAAPLLGDPNISDAIKGVLKPEYIPFYVLVVSIVTVIARNRTLGKDQS